MATIMSWGISSGKKRSCTSTCHNAKHDRCACICSGRFHGSARQPGGVEQAVRDTWEEAVEQAEEKAAAEGMELDTSRLRKFIGLEPVDPPAETVEPAEPMKSAKPANDANPVNGDTPTNHDNPGKRRQWSTINRANHKTGAQVTLPLEVA